MFESVDLPRLRCMAGIAVCAAFLLAWFTPAGHGAEPDSAKPEARQQAPLAYIAVTGAPGDGEAALTAALAKRLAAAGVKPGSAQSADVYSVEGIVEIAPAKGGRQSVRIDWRVFAPDGTTLGGVSQVKLVRKGSLDKKWGPAADAAAAAAAGAIAKLIPH